MLWFAIHGDWFEAICYDGPRDDEEVKMRTDQPHRPLSIAAVLAVVFATAQVCRLAFAACDPDGVQSSGAIFRLCVPETGWNGDLVIFAHGYVAFHEPPGIPENQLYLPDGSYLPDLVNALGFAFATTGYSQNGLAVVEGLADIVELPELFAAAYGPAGRVYLAGASEGGLITALAVEKHPEMFAGGLATCGPIGDFRAHVNYLGDVRVLFDYFFAGVLPGSPVTIPQEVIADWDSYESQIRAALALAPGRTLELLRVARVPVANFSEDAVPAIAGVLWYNVHGTNDAAAKLGGRPYENSRRRYSGSSNDLLLNLRVPRFAAAAPSLGEIMEHYNTSGALKVPLVTLHTLHDPIVPAWHEILYSIKTALTGSSANRLNLIVPGSGHCEFTPGEVILAFAALVQRVTGQEPQNLDSVLAGVAEE